MYPLFEIHYSICSSGQHADYVETACIMFDIDTGHYLDAFDCPMRFALHDVSVREILSVVM